MNKFFNKQRLFITVLIALIFSACASTVNISDDMSPAEIVQRAQEAMDRNRYNVAIQYYQALHDRNRNNIDLIITAEYHIAFIHYKQGKFAQAREEFNAVLAYFDSPDEELLPQHFKRLSQIVLQQIDVKENQRRSLFRR